MKSLNHVEGSLPCCWVVAAVYGAPGGCHSYHPLPRGRTPGVSAVAAAFGIASLLWRQLALLAERVRLTASERVCSRWLLASVGRWRAICSWAVCLGMWAVGEGYALVMRICAHSVEGVWKSLFSPFRGRTRTARGRSYSFLLRGVRAVGARGVNPLVVVAKGGVLYVCWGCFGADFRKWWCGGRL